MIKNSILFSLLINSCSAFSQLSEYHVIAARTHEPQFVYSADLDGDGDLDILVASADDNKIVWFENLGGGIFDSQKIISDNARSAWSVHADDLDGDGDLDVLSASGGDAKIAWYENLGGGIFSNERIISLEASGAISVYSSDLDNDGKIDVISASTADDKIAWYKNLGGGSFGPQIIVSNEMNFPVSIYAIDIDGDGFKDVLGASNFDDKIVWFKNDGFGNFSVPFLISNSANQAQSVFAIDLDGDSDPDVLSASAGDDKIAWYENLGGGTFGVEQIISTDAELAEQVYAADLDSDGDNDILSTSFGDAKVAWYENLGAGLFGGQEIITVLTANAVSVHVGDVDGDGELDVISAGIAHDRVVWQKNLGAGIFDDESFITTDPHFPISGTTGDIDNDGDIDVISGSDYLEKIMVFKNDGNGDFDKEIIINAGIEAVTSLAASDLDLDGDLDILASASNPYSPDKLIWFENLGGGIFGDEILVSDDVLKGQSVVASDLNADSYPDIVLAERGGRVSCFINEGDGTFDDKITLSTDSDAPYCVFTTDLDNDGDLDILVASYLDDKISWLENTGFGVFDDEQIITTEADGAYWVHSEDLDNDGDLDVLSASRNDNKVAWYENLGDVTWSDQKILSNESTGARSVYTADIDGDGDADVLAASELNNRIDWFENLGGTFMGRQEISTRAMAARWVYSADFDGDSDADVLTISMTNDEILWHKNQYLSPLRITGNCFFDVNANGIRDTNDFDMKFVDINCSPTPIYTYTNFEGVYVADFPKGIIETFVISPAFSELWTVSTDSLSYHVNSDGLFESIDSANFGFIPNAKVDSLSAYLTGGRPRCDSEVNYWIDLHNLGNTIASGVIKLELAEEIMFLSASIPPDSIVEQSIYWHYDSLYYYGETDINLFVEMPSADFIDETLISILSVTIDSSGTILFIEEDTLSQILVCSFDPNDKLVTPIGIDSLGYIPSTTESLEYTIRFQNTGTDTAYTVRVKDQLDPNLDWTSLTFLASSHEMTTTLFPSGEIIFKFDNILLPDSNINQLASHGFVRFKVDLKEGLPLGARIYNHAEIYFDANSPVVTNTTINTLFDCQHLLDYTNVTSAICKGDSFVAEALIVSENFIYSWNLFDVPVIGDTFSALFDTSGTFDLELSVSTAFCETDTVLSISVFPYFIGDTDTLVICNGDSLLIFGNYQTESGLYFDSLTTIHGCDSVFVKFLEILPTYEISMEEIFICDGDSILIFGSYRSIDDVYLDTVYSIHGCDSILSQPLHIIDDLYSSLVPISICVGDSTLIFGTYQNTPNLFMDTLSSMIGCDSIIIQELIVWALPDVMISVADEIICLGGSPITLNSSPSGGEFSGVAVSGSEFSPSIAGLGIHTLFYTFEDENGCSATDSIQVTVVDCLSLPSENQSKITIYPNPFDNYTTVNFGGALQENHTIIISNILGQEVYRNENVTGSQLEIKKEQLGVGIFLLTLYNADLEQIYTAKLVVN